MENRYTTDLIEYLSQFITPNKRELFKRVLALRTRHITVVLEDIFKPHNASAVIRSCDCFGVQDLYVIENRNRYTINPDVTRGSSKWVDLYRFNKRDRNNTPDCIAALKEKGYRIVATTPHQQSCPLDELPIEKPAALLFGTEKTGLSETALELADDFVHIPMCGFTESLNISVSVAITLYNVIYRLRKSDVDWRIPERESHDINLRWIRKVLKRANLLEEQFSRSRRGDGPGNEKPQSPMSD